MIRVTDILIRGGGGTITFSDGHTEEFFYTFLKDSTVPGGGIFGITLEGDRANIVYKNVLSQALCDTIDWLLRCSALNARVAVLEAQAGLAKSFEFEAADWDAGPIDNRITIINEGVPGAGELGPHELGNDVPFFVTVFRNRGASVIVEVDVEVSINLVSGDITLRKTGTDFDGQVILSTLAAASI